MQHPLDGCWAKLERANESIRNLEAEIDAWGKTMPPPYSVVPKLDHDRKAYTFTAFGSPPPLRYTVLAGEIVHHLRSSLDHLIWALALLRNTNPSGNIQFPICDAREKFDKACAKGILRGIPESAKIVVESVQPYHEPEPMLAPLAVLNRFSNTDKHRLLLVVGNVAVLGDTIDIDGGEDHATEITGMSAPPELLSIGASNKGTEVFSVQFGRYSPKAKITANFTIQISFQEFGRGKDTAIISGLSLIREAVSTTLKKFTSAF